MHSNVFNISKPFPDRKYTVDEVLEEIARGPFQRFVLIACGFALMFPLTDTLCVGFVIPLAECDLQLDTFRKGVLTGASFFGIAISSHASGFLTDQWGRKKAISLSLALGIVFSTLAALVPDYWTVVAFRVLSGMSLASAASGSFAYMSEFFPVQQRGAAIMYASSLSSMGQFLMPLLGLLQGHDLQIAITETYTLTFWRLQLLAHLTPGIAALILVWQLPESPKYLMAANRMEECLDVLHTMYEKNTMVPRYHCKFQELKPLDNDHTSGSKQKSLFSICRAMVHETALLFRPPNLRIILSCCFLQFGAFFVAGGFGLWFPELVNRILNTSTSDEAICDLFTGAISSGSNDTELLLEQRAACVATANNDMYISNSVLGFAHVIFFFALAMGLNKISLKITLAAMLVMSALCTLLLQHLPSGFFVLFAFVLLILGCGLSLSLINATAVELFPTHLRGMAIAMSILIGRMGTVTGANVIGFLLEWDCSSTFYATGALVLVCVLVSISIPRKNRPI